MSKVDFQELLNEEIVVKGRNKNNEVLLEVLEKKTNDKKQNFLEEFNKLLVRDIKEDKTIQDRVSKDIKAKEDKKEDLSDEDMLISDMIKNDEETTKEEDKKEEAEISENFGEEVSTEEIEAKYENEDLTNSQKAYAYIYEKAMKEYFKLKMSIERQNIKDGELDTDDRNFLRLMRLKEVATKAELWFKNSTHGSYIGEKIESIGEMEKSSSYEVSQYQKQNNKQHEASKEKIDSINTEIDSTLDEINSLAQSLDSLEGVAKSDALGKMDDLNKKYIDLNKQLEAMTPDAIELARQEEKLKQQSDIEDREFGYVDERKSRKSTNVTSKEYAREKHVDSKKEDLTENGIVSSNEALEITATDVKNTIEKSIQDAIDNKNYALAAELVDNYQKTLTSDVNSKDDKEVEKKAEEFRKEIDENIDTQIEEEELDDSDLTTNIITGVAVGAAASVVMGAGYPTIHSQRSIEISGLNDIKQPEEIAEDTALNPDKMEEVENISEGKKANKNREETIDKQI